MAYQYHEKKTRKIGTGGKYRRNRDKKKAHFGGHFASTRVGPFSRRISTTRGGGSKVAVTTADYANVVMPNGEVKKAKIIAVVESPSNREFTRMNIITKGAIIETDTGKAKVTSRPGQHGVINAVLLK
ncbi:MAG: 30S ribosomal protein S8e [Candidatus Micrarchaeia archaeon]